MTDTQVESPAGATTPVGVRRRLTGVLRTLLGPLWATTFRDPVRQGRLRLDGQSGPERQLSQVGLVTLVLLLVSLLFMDVWRRGSLVRLEGHGRALFVPEALVPVTLAAFVVALALIVWGALDAGPVVRVLVAVAYVGTVGVLDVPVVVAESSWLAEHGTTVVRASFAVPAFALVLSALTARATRVSRWLTPVLRALCLVAFSVLLATLLWLDHRAAEQGFRQALPDTLNAGFVIIDALLTPLVIFAAVAVVDFASDVSTSLTEPATRVRGRLLWFLRAVLFALVLVKLWVEVVDEQDYWRAYLDRQAESVVRTAPALALLLVTCLVVNRLLRPGSDEAADEAVTEAKERLTLGGAALLSGAYFPVVVLTGLGLILFRLTDETWLAEVAQDYPTDAVAEWFPMGASVLALSLGCWLLHRHRNRPGRLPELATGLVVLGVWNVQAWAVTVAHASWGFSHATIGVLVTLGVLAWAVLGWRRLDASRTSLLIAVLLFSWLVMSRGDYISFLGGLLGLPAVVVVVFGIVYTMASGSGFASESSRRLPREARTLMFIGYLLLSVTILHWTQAVHQSSIDLGILGFHYLGIPLAAWLVARRMVPRSQAATDLR